MQTHSLTSFYHSPPVHQQTNQPTNCTQPTPTKRVPQMLALFGEHQVRARKRSKAARTEQPDCQLPQRVNHGSTSRCVCSAGRRLCTLSKFQRQHHNYYCTVAAEVATGQLQLVVMMQLRKRDHRLRQPIGSTNNNNNFQCDNKKDQSDYSDEDLQQQQQRSVLPQWTNRCSHFVFLFSPCSAPLPPPLAMVNS